MKQVIALLSVILLISHVSHALFAMDNNTLDWQEIRSSDEYQVQKKQINFQGQLLNVFDVCSIDDTQLRSKQALSTYQWNEAQSDDRGPASTEKSYLTTDIDYQKSYSDGDSTRETQESYPISYKLTVNNLFSGKQFSKEYQIPAC